MKEAIKANLERGKPTQKLPDGISKKPNVNTYGQLKKTNESRKARKQ